ncbi:MAG TPA: hypothetical protein VEJ41_03010 [Candidatus Acidoferrales bacterium]|nr:hypothetical protein [Candidatus Acidoferrales bacterium]
MTDETLPQSQDDDFGVSMPPNARIGQLFFDDKTRTLHVSLADGGEERIIDIADLRSFFGARIRHVSVTRVPPKSQGVALSATALRATGGLPQSALNPTQRTGTEVVSEDLNYAVAMRVEKLPELWYLNANSFNFRKTLGDDATFSTEINLRSLIRRLSQFAPDAVRDGFFTAVLQGSPLPPPLDSLLEFFRIVAR